MSWGLVTGNNGLGVQATGPTTTISMSFVNAVSSGDMAVVGMSTYLYNTADAATVTDNKTGNTWANDTGHSTGHFDAEILHSVIANGGSGFAVTVATPHNGFPSISLDEFSGGGAATVDSFIACPATTSFTNVPAVGSLTVSGTDLIYAVLGLDKGAPTATPSLTAGYQAGYVSSQAEGIYAQYQLNATSAVNPAWSLSASETIYACGVAYKAAGGAATSLVIRPFPSIPSAFFSI